MLIRFLFEHENTKIWERVMRVPESNKNVYIYEKGVH